MNIQDFVRYGLKREIPELLDHSDEMAITTQLELGPGSYPNENATHFLDFPEWDADTGMIPFADEQFRVVHMYHFLEHVKDPIKILREAERVLVPGGHINITVPHGMVEIGMADLDHKHFFVEEVWRNLFNNDGYEKNRREPWKLKVHANFLCGVTYRNLCLFTQLRKDI